MRRAAFRAGITASEFWNMTAAETLVCIEEREKRELTDAWLVAALMRIKELPERPSALWRENAHPEASADTAADMVAAAQARFTAWEREQKRTKVNGKT